MPYPFPRLRQEGGTGFEHIIRAHNLEQKCPGHVVHVFERMHHAAHAGFAGGYGEHEQPRNSPMAVVRLPEKCLPVYMQFRGIGRLSRVACRNG